jgi:putative RecB family exonuclease
MAVYSHSRLETFRNCPRKYYYRYIKRVKLPDEPENIAAFLGLRIHETLEHLYDQARQGQVMNLPDLLAYYEALWQEKWHNRVVVQDPSQSTDYYLELGRSDLRGYYERHKPFDEARTVALEMRVWFSVDQEDRYRMIGFVDRIARRPDGVWQVHDYKSGRTLPSEEDLAADRQLVLYEIALRSMWSDVDQIELIWHFLRFDTSIKIESTPEKRDQVRSDTIETIDDIEGRHPSTESFPTHVSELCSYCEYETICPARRHLIQIKTPPRNLFTEGS